MRFHTRPPNWVKTGRKDRKQTALAYRQVCNFVICFYVFVSMSWFSVNVLRLTIDSKKSSKEKKQQICVHTFGMFSSDWNHDFVCFTFYFHKRKMPAKNNFITMTIVRVRFVPWIIHSFIVCYLKVINIVLNTR